MTQPGETDNYSARQHLETIRHYAPEIHFDFVIVNDKKITTEQAERYALEGAHQIGLDDDALDSVLDRSTQVVRANLLEEGEKVRHNSDVLADVVLACRQHAQPVVPAYLMPKDPALPSAQTNQPLDVVILAAGLGTRMKSSRAK